MSQSQYFIDKFSKQDQKSLYENPDNFLMAHKRQLTQIVRDDVQKLAAIATPVHTIKHGCNQWDSWTDHYYWYHVNHDNKKVASEMFKAYYDICKIGGLDVWDLNDATLVFEILSREKDYQDLMFNCLRTVYFYNNYNNKNAWNMSWIRPENRIAHDGQIETTDFVDFDCKTKVYKQRHSKQVLSGQINKYCENIAGKATNAINDDVWMQKRQSDTARTEIEQAYATLKKYHLMGTDIAVNKR